MIARCLTVFVHTKLSANFARLRPRSKVVSLWARPLLYVQNRDYFSWHPITAKEAMLFVVYWIHKQRLSTRDYTNSMITIAKFVIDFSLCSLYNMSIEYLRFAHWQTKYLCYKASEGVCLWALFCVSMTLLHKFIPDRCHKAYGQYFTLAMRFFIYTQAGDTCQKI